MPLWERDMCDSSFPEAFELSHAGLAAWEQVTTVNRIFLDSDRAIGNPMVDPRAIDLQDISQLSGCVDGRQLTASDFCQIRHDPKSPLIVSTIVRVNEPPRQGTNPSSLSAAAI